MSWNEKFKILNYKKEETATKQELFDVAVDLIKQLIHDIEDNSIYTCAKDLKRLSYIFLMKNDDYQEIIKEYRQNEDKVEREWNSYWKEIVEKDGVVDMEQVKKELCDYSFLLENVPIVYNEIAGLSYPNYPANVILTQHNERHIEKGIAADDVSDMIEQCLTKEELIESLKEYFDIENA